MPTGGHFEDIHVHCPAMWSWMTVLLQYWQDHMTPHLYGGRFHRISDLTATVIRDINPWLPHQVRFSWGYVAMNATLWIDQRDHFSVEHLIIILVYFPYVYNESIIKANHDQTNFKENRWQYKSK